MTRPQIRQRIVGGLGEAADDGVEHSLAAVVGHQAVGLLISGSQFRILHRPPIFSTTQKGSSKRQGRAGAILVQSGSVLVAQSWTRSPTFDRVMLNTVRLCPTTRRDGPGCAEMEVAAIRDGRRHRVMMGSQFAIEAGDGGFGLVRVRLDEQQRVLWPERRHGWAIEVR